MSRTWRKAKTDWEAWCRRDLGAEDVVRLVLDGMMVRAPLDHEPASVSLLMVLGIHRDGQKVLLAARSMGGESEAAWRAVLDDLVARGLRTPEFLIVDGAAGPDRALAALWPRSGRRCRRSGAGFTSTGPLWRTPPRCCTRRCRPTTRTRSTPRRPEDRAASSCFPAKAAAALCLAVAESLEEAGERLFTFTRLHPRPWKSARTTNAIERLREEAKRRVKTQTVLPSAETTAMLPWALLASGQITMCRVDGWQSLGRFPAASTIDLAGSSLSTGLATNTSRHPVASTPSAGRSRA